MTKLTLGLVLLIGGCAAVPSEREQRTAIAAIWYGVYEAPWSWEPPSVSFVAERCLETQNGACVDGDFRGRVATAGLPAVFEIRVGLAASLRSSSLAHELRHAWHWRHSRERDADEDHESLGWKFIVPDAEQIVAD